MYVLASIPDINDMLVTALEASAEVPKLEVVTERLLHEDSKRWDKESSNADGKAMALEHRNPRKAPNVITLERLVTLNEMLGTDEEVPEK